MKKEFSPASLSLIAFPAEDVIETSGPYSELSDPDVLEEGWTK